MGHQDTSKKLLLFAEKNKIPDFLFDPDDGMSRKYRMTYGGGVAFIDRGGTVRMRVPKGFSPATLEQAIQKIIAKQPASQQQQKKQK